MAFITYVLLYGLSQGMGSSKFSPDLIIKAIWRCLILQTLETVIIKFGTNVLAVSVPFLDIFAYTGYKYVALSANITTRMLNGYLHFLTTAYTSVMIAHFVLKSLAAVVPVVSKDGSSTRVLVLLGFGACQFLLVFILSWM